MANSSANPAKRAAPTPTPPRAAPSANANAPMKWHILLQGDVLELIESPTTPDLTTKPGERRKRIIASFLDKEAALKRYELEAPRARGVTGKGEAY